MIKNKRKIRILNIIFEAIKLRKVWWFTAWSRTEERFARTSLGSFWLGLSNLLSISLLSVVYGTVFKVDNFNKYVVYLGLGMVLWSSISTSIGSAPNLLIQNEIKIMLIFISKMFFLRIFDE